MVKYRAHDAARSKCRESDRDEVGSMFGVDGISGLAV
jgi:hypothetical protein